MTLIVVATISVGAYYSRRGDAAPILTTGAATRGNIVNVIAATGTLQAITTVEVGSQVSGTVESLKADLNQLVKKGDVLATLDQSLYASALEEARASLVGAEADAEGLRVAQAAADVALTRTRELASRQLLAAADLEAAESADRSAAAQVVGADARIRQAHSAVQSAQVNLARTVIVSPIDGFVTARNVEVGQTVAASLSAQTLFVLAADLSKMQVNASIDESDVGQVHAPNTDMKLKPGMTANVTIEVARRDDVLRVPGAALRFKPDADVLARFGVKGLAVPATKSDIVWVSNGGFISPIVVKVGARDTLQAEVLGTPFTEGTVVVTRASSGVGTTMTGAATSNAGNPLLR